MTNSDNENPIIFIDYQGISDFSEGHIDTLPKQKIAEDFNDYLNKLLEKAESIETLLLY